MLAGGFFATWRGGPRLTRRHRPHWTKWVELVGGAKSLPRPLQNRPHWPLRTVRVYHRQRQPDGRSAGRLVPAPRGAEPAVAEVAKIMYWITGMEQESLVQVFIMLKSTRKLSM